MYALYIPDGDRRYARERGISYVDAYREGAHAALRAARQLERHGFYTYIYVTNSQTYNRSDGSAEIIHKVVEEFAPNKVTHERLLIDYNLEEDVDQAIKTAKSYAEFRGALRYPDLNLVVRCMCMSPSHGPVYAMRDSVFVTVPKPNPEVQPEDIDKAVKEFWNVMMYRSVSRE